MPELPEVQTVVATLETLIKDRKIVQVEILYPPIIGNDDTFESNVINQSFRSFSRKGKFLILGLDRGYLVVHLRMEGKFYVVKQDYLIDKHTHVIFHLDDGSLLLYHDVRKFGRINYIKRIEDHAGLNRLGHEVWDPLCDINYLKEKTANKRVAVKTMLLDQSIIAGIGNIYANEILFKARIHPELPSNQLSDEALQLILDKTKEILEAAIEAGGTSIRSYTSQLGVTGLFQQSLKVHGKENEPCLVCATPIVKKQVNGRGTYFCTVCQKMKQE